MLAELAHTATFLVQTPTCMGGHTKPCQFHASPGERIKLVSLVHHPARWFVHSTFWAKHSRRLSILMDHAVYTQHFTSS